MVLLRTEHTFLLVTAWLVANFITSGAGHGLAQGANISIFVLEESEIGTPVVDLFQAITHLQKQQNGSAVTKSINQVRILDRTPFFYVNDRGQLAVKERIDREELCTVDSSSENRIEFIDNACYFHLQIFVTYRQQTVSSNDGYYPAAPDYTLESFDTVQVYILVRDVNDHFPEFNGDPLDAGFEVRVKEHAPAGTKFELPSASDLDSGVNGELTYSIGPFGNWSNSILQASRMFAVENVKEHAQANLIVLADLDRETRAAYLLNLSVCDNGKPNRRCVSRKLTVTLLDVNDHVPLISNASSYSVDVREDAAVPVTLTKIEASDGDDRDGQHGVLEFRIDPARSTAGAAQQFAIDSSTGQLRLISPLDREKMQRHRVVVVVLDSPNDASNSRSATCTVTVNVLDVNDQAPVIKVLPTSQKTDFGDYYPTNAYASQDESSNLPTLFVLEQNLPDTVLALITVTDADAGVNGRTSCSIDDDRNFRLNPSPPNDYRLQAKQSFDFERQKSYLIHVECIDFGEPQQRQTEPIQVLVVDRNDNPPRFNVSSLPPSTVNNVYARASVQENNPIDAVLFRIGISDADTDAINLRHKIAVQNFAELFYVTNSTSPSVALLRASVSLDRETLSEYNVTISLSDQTCRCPQNVTSNSTLHLTISVTDVNDNVPVIVTNNVTIPENLHFVNLSDPNALNHYIGKLEARDADEGVNAELTFSLVTAEFDYPKVEVSSEGDLYLAEGQFDRELRTDYCLIVRVRDGGDPLLESSTRVCILVTDENDHQPVWNFPARGNDIINVSLPESALQNTFKAIEVARLSATDYDADAFGSVQYSIVRGNELGIFSVDGDSLLLQRAPMFRELSETIVFKLVLDASDRAQPPRSSLTVLNVHFSVDNVNNIFMTSFRKPKATPSDLLSPLMLESEAVKSAPPSMTTWIIVGSAIGAIVVLAALVALAVHCHMLKSHSQVPKFTKNLRSANGRAHHSSFCTLCSSCVGAHSEAHLEAGVSVIEHYNERARAQPHVETTAQITYRAESGDESESNCLVHNGTHKNVHLSTFRATASGSSYCTCPSCQSTLLNNRMQPNNACSQFSHAALDTTDGRMTKHEPVEADSLLSSQNQDMSENQHDVDSQNENKLNVDSVSRMGSTNLNVANTPSDNNESGISIWETRRPTLEEMSRQKSDEAMRFSYNEHEPSRQENERNLEREHAEPHSKAKKKKRPKILTVTATSKVAFSNSKAPVPSLLCAPDPLAGNVMRRSATASPSANYFRFAMPGDLSTEVSNADSMRSSMAMSPNADHRMAYSSHCTFGSPRYPHGHHFPVTPACDCAFCNQVPEAADEHRMNNLLMQIPEAQLHCCQEAREHFTAYSHNPHANAASSFHNYHRQISPVSPVSPPYGDAKRIKRPASVIGQLPMYASCDRNALPVPAPPAAAEGLETASGVGAKHYQNPPYVTTSFV